MKRLVTTCTRNSVVCRAWLLVVGESARPASVADDAPLPAGVRAIWDIEKSHREPTPTRERICINGLWRWQPAQKADGVPAGRWGYFKVPGCWPGVSDYMQHDCQTVYLHPSWKAVKPAEVAAAWYQREISVPREWAGRRVTLCLEYLNSSTAVFVDGKKVGEVQFPAGQLDLTSVCRPGRKHILSLLVAAKPLQEVMLMFNDTNAARRVSGSVQRRGLCGDAYLVGTPAGPRIDEVKVDTSVRQGEITLSAALANLASNAQYALLAVITDRGRTVKEFTGKAFTAGDLKDGRVAVTEKWKPEKLWDIHTPQNMYEVSVSLVEAGPGFTQSRKGAEKTEGGKILDAAWPVRFGFRELWTEGRDFYLNGTRVFLSALPLDNAQVSASAASYEGARESLLRLKRIGINFVYTHNYGCEPGTHVSFEEILCAADDVGMLVALSQPHFAHYDWQMPGAPQNNGYAHHARFYVGVAGSHPSVVFYSMSHNSTGYDEDMNPEMIDGIQSARSQWAENNVKRALQNTQTWTSLFDYQSFTPTGRVAHVPLPGAVQRDGRQEYAIPDLAWQHRDPVAGGHHHGAGGVAFDRRPMVAGSVPRSARGVGRSVPLLPLVRALVAGRARASGISAESRIARRLMGTVLLYSQAGLKWEPSSITTPVKPRSSAGESGGPKGFGNCLCEQPPSSFQRFYRNEL